jgi:hypothetical protein
MRVYAVAPIQHRGVAMIARLRAKVGELTMDNELLLQRCRVDCPFVSRRPRR